jgi:HAD superfamily hydrolase (TIGR01549 family)
VAILDVDGTLVDTNYQHALAWYRAFRRFGIVLPIWRIHRHVGMGGDQLIPALCGDRVDPRTAEEIRSERASQYRALIEETEPVEGARELMVELKDRGLTVVLASSSPPEELDHYLDLLDARDIADAWTTADDVEATKPEPDLVHAALERGARGKGIMIGDSTWDCEAARRARVQTIAVLTGGFSEQELHDAGAVAVFTSVEELRAGLDDTPLRGSGQLG